MSKANELTYDDIDGFLGLPPGSFDHIPEYVKIGCMKAIAKVREMERTSLFRPGLYYILLVDLCGSTKSAEKLGADLNARRIQWFITACVESLGTIQLRNYAQFIKDIGDAALFLFSSIEDIFTWIECADRAFEHFTTEFEFWDELQLDEKRVEELLPFFEIRTRKVLHLGEVQYTGKANPIALAINQACKIEKHFQNAEVGCTDVVARTIHPYSRTKPLTTTQEGADRASWRKL
jgi:class 3 adenylate cyclase